MKFWDPEDHVFQFKIAKLCPTIEEFFAILGYDPSKKSVAVSCDPKYRSLCLMLLVFLLPSLVVWLNMVNLQVIISRLIKKCTYGVIDNIQKNFGLALRFVGEFMLCFRRHGFMDSRAISVVSQIKDGDNLVSLILEETLLGLDVVFHGRES